MATYKKQISVSGNWLKGGDVQSGMKCKIMSETTPTPSQFKDKNGNSKNQDVTKILFQGSTEPVNVNLNRATINGLVDAFGEDSKDWVGKVLTAETEKVRIAGRAVTAVYFIPAGYERVDDENGYTMIVKIGEKVSTPPNDDEIPVINLDEEIKMEDIPF